MSLNGDAAGLLMDTGAAISVITPQAVAEERLFARSSRFRLGGIGGESFAREVGIDHLGIGGAEAADVTFMEGTLWKRSLDEYPVFGLLGQDLLSNWDLDLEAGRDRLTLYDADTCPAAPAWTKHAIAVDQTGSLTGRINLPVELDGHAVDAMIDTGSAITTVRADLLGGPADAGAKAVTLMGVGQSPVRGVRRRVSHLAIGGVDLGPMTVVAADDLNGLPMLLGTDFLRRHRVFIAWHANKLFIAPGPTGG